MFSIPRVQRTISLMIFVLPALLFGCSSEPDPSFAVESGGWWVNCPGNFVKRYSLSQQNVLEPQDVTIQLNPVANGNMPAGISLTPTAIGGLTNDTLHTLTIAGSLEDRCKLGRITLKTDGATGLTAEQEVVVPPVPAIITIGDITTQGANFSYTASITCCPGSDETVELAFRPDPFASVSSINPPNPETLTLQCGANPQPAQVVITGTLADPAQSGRNNLFVNSADGLECIEDTTIPVPAAAE